MDVQQQLEQAQNILKKQKEARAKYKTTEKGIKAVKSAKKKYREKTKTIPFKCLECDCSFPLSTKSYHYNNSKRHKKTLEAKLQEKTNE